MSEETSNLEIMLSSAIKIPGVKVSRTALLEDIFEKNIQKKNWGKF